MSRSFAWSALSCAGVFSALLTFSSCVALADNNEKGANWNASKILEVPNSLANRTLVYTIENAVANKPEGIPYQGAVVETYNADGSYKGQGYGTMQDVPLNQQVFVGQYKYRRTGINTAEVRGFDTTSGKVPFVTTYKYETDSSGRFEQNWGNGTIVFSGQFVVQNNARNLAPDTNAGSYTLLWIKAAESSTLPAGVYPNNALIMQTYNFDGTLAIKGYGHSTLDWTGTYKFTKIAPTVAIEEVVQTNSYFTLPYTMVYIYDTPDSGRWFQNLGNGWIKFSGTFGTVPQ